jgi:hypothetical protein
MAVLHREKSIAQICRERDITESHVVLVNF